MTSISGTSTNSIYNLPYLSNDIINIIFSYMQSNTNIIMKQFINDVEPCYKIFCYVNPSYKRENHLKNIMTVKLYGVNDMLDYIYLMNK